MTADIVTSNRVACIYCCRWKSCTDQRVVGGRADQPASITEPQVKFEVHNGAADCACAPLRGSGAKVGLWHITEEQSACGDFQTSSQSGLWPADAGGFISSRPSNRHRAGLPVGRHAGEVIEHDVGVQNQKAPSREAGGLVGRRSGSSPKRAFISAVQV